jgi:hypothetical protein
MDNLPYEPIRDDNGNPIVVSSEQYFAQSSVNHPHPQGWPCHVNCRDGDS